MLIVEGTLSFLAPPYRNEGLCLLEKGRLRSQQGKRPSREEAKAERPSLSLSLEAERREDQDAVRAGQVPGAWHQAGTADTKTWAAGGFCVRQDFRERGGSGLPRNPQTKQGEGEDRRGRGRLPGGAFWWVDWRVFPAPS